MKERTGKTKNVSVPPDGGTMNDQPRQNRDIFFFPFAVEPQKSPSFFCRLAAIYLMKKVQIRDLIDTYSQIGLILQGF